MDERRLKAWGEEFALAEAILAHALGYHYSTEYGWATGDHTPVTLAAEAARRINPDLSARGLYQLPTTRGRGEGE